VADIVTGAKSSDSLTHLDPYKRSGSESERNAVEALVDTRVARFASDSVTGESVLLEAQRLTHGNRNDAYGHPLDDYSRTAKLWSAILGIDVLPEQAALCMCAVKISRQCNRPKRDNMTDLAGYAWVVDEIVEETSRREKLDRART
jgi:hypothetical protein